MCTVFKSPDKVKTIGVLSFNYAAQRLFLNKMTNAKYKDIRIANKYMWKNTHLWILHILHQLKMSPEEIVAKLFYDYEELWPIGCDIFHFFNCINHTPKTSWVLSVESGVPWTIEITRAVEKENVDLSQIKNNSHIIECIKALANPKCLALLPLCNCSYRIQMEILKQFPAYENVIKAKTYTLHPPQQLIINDLKEKGLTWDDNEEFIFFYVGKNFYRKGGRESVSVLANLRKKYNNFRLVLISALEPDESRYMRSTNDEIQIRKMIAANADWIDFYQGLPNDQVLRKLKKAHVCLLPTWMDTYAYSVLESQACGTPLITTAQRALNETNSEDVGWLIEVPVNKLNNPLHYNSELQEKFSSMLLQGLQEKCEYVLTHRQEVKQKSFACLERIRKFHDPRDYAKKLELIYQGKVSELISKEEYFTLCTS